MSDIQQPPDWATHQVRPIVGLGDDPSTCICWDCRAWREIARLREQVAILQDGRCTGDESDERQGS